MTDMKIHAPIRVIPDGNRIWNDGGRHMYPFSVQMNEVPEAIGYSLVCAQGDKRVGEVMSEEPVVSLDSIWEVLDPGFVRLAAWVHFKDGIKKKTGESYRFYRATGYRPELMNDPQFPLEQAIETSYDYLTNTRYSDNHDPGLPPFVWHAAVHVNTGLLTRKSYPGLHYCNYIWAFMEYAEYNPEKRREALRYAAIVAEKARAFATPSDYVWHGVPYSTISDGQMGGDQEKDDVIQPLKCALLASSLWDYSVKTDCQPSRQMAVRIADVLKEQQKMDGSFPIRLNARTGQVLADNSTNIVFAIELWERLEPDFPGVYAEAKEKALRWMWEHPLTTFRWISNFEDVGIQHMDEDSANYNNADALYAAMYLLKHRDRAPSYFRKALEISNWVEEGFAFYKNEYPLEGFDFPCPSVMEQAAHYFAIDSHLARFALLQLALYEATKDAIFLEKAKMAAHSLTHYINKDGFPLTYPEDRVTGVATVSQLWFRWG